MDKCKGWAIQCFRTRPRLGYTQAEMAAKTGIPYARYTRFETGLLTPTDKEMQQICKALKCQRYEIETLAREGRPIVLGAGHDQV